MKSKSKVNSTLYSISQDDLDNNNNKYKFEDFNNVYKDNPNDENTIENKNMTISNFKSSRNNYSKIFNRKGNKQNNMSQQSSLINIKSYTKKNFSNTNLRKNKSKNNGRNNSIDLNRKTKEIKKKLQNGSFLNITSNTINLNKNNIMINLNQKNVNIENLKVKKKLNEYQKLIDQKLNQLIKNHHPYNKTMLQIRRNSSPNFEINNKNSQQKNSPLLGIEFVKKINKSKIKVNSNSIKDRKKDNRNNNSMKQISIIDSKRKRNLSKNIKKNNNTSYNSKGISNIKLILNKVNFNSKLGDLNSSRQGNESMLTNEKSFLSLRKYIFAKSNNSLSNNNNIK